MSETAKYSIHSRCGVVDYELAGDIVTVSTKVWNFSNVRIPIRLSDLEPLPLEQQSRDVWPTVIVFLAAWVLWTMFYLCLIPFSPVNFRLVLFFAVLSCCLPVACILFAFFHPFRIFSIVYRYQSGIHAFAISRRGRATPEFDAFVEALNRAIPRKEVQR